MQRCKETHMETVLIAHFQSCLTLQLESALNGYSTKTVYTECKPNVVLCTYTLFLFWKIIFVRYTCSGHLKSCSIRIGSFMSQRGSQLMTGNISVK
jgi:hypothetical protein